jgi:hypothetical protein
MANEIGKVAIIDQLSKTVVLEFENLNHLNIAVEAYRQLFKDDKLRYSPIGLMPIGKKLFMFFDSVMEARSWCLRFQIVESKPERRI